MHVEDIIDAIPNVLLAAFAGPTCAPWERLGDGFEDPRSKTFMTCAGILSTLAEYGILTRS
jgi:hypothetical protein